MHPSHTSKVAFVGIILLQLAFAQVASAQAWLPRVGEGTVTILHQNILARGHLSPTGVLVGDGPVRSHSVAFDVEYGLTNRVALNVSLPFVTAAYGGPSPHRLGVHDQPSTTDDGTYHGSFQDFRFGVRFNVAARPLVVTPFADVILPSHHYESRGHAVVGQDLRAVAVGVNLGAFSETVLPGVYIQGQLSHVIVQKVADMRPNRSRVEAEVGYFASRRLAVRFIESLQITHGGLDFPYSGLSPELTRNHDRLSRNNFLNLGGGPVFAINESLQVSATVSALTWGQNIHTHRGLGLGLNWHFRTPRARPPGH